MRFFKEDEYILIERVPDTNNFNIMYQTSHQLVGIGSIQEDFDSFKARWYVHPCKSLEKEYSAPELSLIIQAIMESFELDSIFRVKFV